jgi:GTPase
LRKRSEMDVQELEERVIAVSVQMQHDSDQATFESLGELKRLIETLGGKLVQTVIQKRQRPSPSHFIGVGKSREIAVMVKELGATLVAFDQELSGSQQKNLENEMGCRVVDRTGVILDIFSRHARTKESKTQVELATLQYLQTHLTRKWTHLERQKGGIGMRGVGEKQLELDRRLIRERISKLKEELSHKDHERSVQRLHRDKFLRVALVGYTNAGKSTLMNRLTLSSVYVDDRLFATLDSTVRVIDPKTRPPILLSDTVGFIDKLPHSLVASFRSTLQEVLEADLLMHVVDLTSPNYQNQIEVTRKVLDDIGAGEKPTLLVFNKVDKVSEFLTPKLLVRRYIDSMVVSAFDPEAMIRLRDFIYSYFERDMVEMEIVVPYRNTWLQSQIHEYSKVISKDYLEEGALFRIRIMRSAASWLKLDQHSRGAGATT